MKRHTIRQGECISSVADANGFFWQTIWDHPENAALKELRRDPNILLPGDQVWVPDKRLREESAATGRSHRYRQKGVPAQLRLRILRNAAPRGGEVYVLNVDNVEAGRGTIPDDGILAISIGPQAAVAELMIGDGDSREVYLLNLGHLDPIDSVSGIKARLNNVGFDCGQANDELDEATVAAILDFQHYINHPAPTGNLDDTTRQSLVSLHD